MHEDHHHQRVDSSADLAGMDVASPAGGGPTGGQTPPHRRASRSSSIESIDDALILELRGKTQRKHSIDFAVLTNSTPLASQWTTDKRTYTNTFDDSEEEDLKASPVDTTSETASPVKASTTGEQKEGRLLIVANRLPVSMKVTKKTGEDGKEFNDVSQSHATVSELLAMSDSFVSLPPLLSAHRSPSPAAPVVWCPPSAVVRWNPDGSAGRVRKFVARRTVRQCEGS
jgi:hypothetical protein